MNDCLPTLSMMMAMDRNKLIGRQGGMPWHIPGEQAYFKAVTMGKPIIMGRKTYESIGKALPGRTNIVVTRSADWQASDAIVSNSLEQAIEHAHQVACQESSPADEIVVIGGARLCEQAMPLTQRLYLTVINHEYEGDTWLNSYLPEQWHEVSSDQQDPEKTGGLDVCYKILRRR